MNREKIIHKTLSSSVKPMKKRKEETNQVSWGPVVSGHDGSAELEQEAVVWKLDTNDKRVSGSTSSETKALVPHDSLFRLELPKNLLYQAQQVLFHPGQVQPSNDLFM